MVPSIQGTLGLTPGWSDTTLDGRVFLQCGALSAFCPDQRAIVVA